MKERLKKLQEYLGQSVTKEEAKKIYKEWCETYPERLGIKKSGLKVKFKKLHPNAVLPTYAKPGDAGLDLTVVEKFYMEDTYQCKVKFGVSVEIPVGFVGRIYPRSSIYKTGLRLCNSVGVIDSGYRGELTAIFDDQLSLSISDEYEAGQRAAQLIIEPIPVIEPEWAEELSETERGEGGYGSSGK